MLMPGGGPVLAPPKTEASRRIVPLPDVVVDARDCDTAVGEGLAD